MPATILLWISTRLPGGKPGQVIEFGRDFHGPVGYIAESVTSLIRQVLAALRAGRYEDDPDSPYLLPMDRIGGSVPAPYQAIRKLDGGTVADVVAGFDDPLAIQELTLHGAAAADLAELSPLRNLRDVQVRDVAAIHPALPHDLPVEGTVAESRRGRPGPARRTPYSVEPEAQGAAEPVTVQPLVILPAFVGA